MAQVLEWFQCSVCGRRQRWTAQIAGTDVRCACGRTVRCPVGAGLDESSLRSATGTLSDTLVEDVDASAAAASQAGDALRRMGIDSPEVPRRLMTPQERQATKQCLIWTGVAMLGFAVMVHALLLMKYWLWWYTSIAILLGLFSFWKFHKARRKWQKGRPIMQALAHSLGAESD